MAVRADPEYARLKSCKYLIGKTFCSTRKQIRAASARSKPSIALPALGVFGGASAPGAPEPQLEWVRRARERSPLEDLTLHTNILRERLLASSMICGAALMALSATPA